MGRKTFYLGLGREYLQITRLLATLKNYLIRGAIKLNLVFGK
jgi:hypothetical protein